ncbi:DUF421 domain-containing protein [Lutibacter sp. B2]|nr:DUF421 domain-containing protein [Lutibacter sp. B2]
MGKSELSEMQPFELVITLMIAELACIPMEDLDFPLIHGILAIVSLLFIQVSLAFLTLKSSIFRRVVCGKPTVLIERGVIQIKALKQLRININDLLQQIRLKDCPNIEDIDFAIMETNGDLSIIKKSKKNVVTLDDLNITSTYKGLPITLIIDGYINKTNLSYAKITDSWLISQLKVKGITDYKNVLLCSITQDQKLFIQTKDERIIP